MQSAFLLFKLPYVILREIHMEMDIYELLKLAQISKKAFQLVQFHCKRFRFEMEVELNFDDFRVKIQSGEKSENFMFQFCESEFVIYSRDPDGNIPTFWKNPEKGVQKFLNFVCNLFPAPETRLYFYDIDRGFAKKILDFCEFFNLPLVYLSYYSSSTKYGRSLLKKLLESKSLSLNIQGLHNNTRNLKFLKTPMEFEEIQVSDAPWAKLEDFWKCQKVTLNDSNNSEKNLKEFLKKWMSQEDSKTDHLNVKMDMENFAKVFEDFRAAPMTQAYLNSDYIHEFEEGQCYLIKRGDGERAIIYYEFGHLTLKTDTYRFE